MKPWELVFRGRVRVAALFLDIGLLGEQEAQKRVLELWEPGASLWVIEPGWVLRFENERTVDAEGPGVPLSLRERRLVAAPLRPGEWASVAAGDVVLVRGGEAVALGLGPQIDPALWLRVELPKADVVSCAGPAAVGSAAAPVVEIGRASFGVPGVSDEAIELLRSIHASVGDAQPKPPEPSWMQRMAGWFQSASPSNPSSTAPPASPGLLAGLGALLEGLVGSSLQGAGLGGLVQQRHAQHLHEMLERFDGDLDEALRHAIPLGGASGLRPAHPALRVPAPRSSLTPNLSASTGGAGSFQAPDDLFALLRQTYEQAAKKLLQDGAIEQAAFVYADLLDDVDEAVAVLETHGRFRLAAELAEARSLQPARVARLYVLAGEVRRALQIAQTQRVFGELLGLFDGQDAQLLRAAYAAHLVGLKRYRAAVDVVWNTSLQPVARAWLLVLVEAGEPRAIVQLAVLDPDTAEQAFAALLSDVSPDAVGQRSALIRALTDQAAPRPWARRLGRQSIRDEGRPGFDPVVVQALFNWEELIDLRADLPRLNRPAPAPGVVVVEEVQAGGVEVFDILPVYGGTLCALGEGGLAKLDLGGRIVWRDATPVSSLVGDEDGFVAIGLHPSGRFQRVHRIDLRLGRVTPWVRTELACWAKQLQHGQWLVAQGNRALSIDLSAGSNPTAWKWTWKGPAMDGPIRFLGHEVGHGFVVLGEPVLQIWKYDDLWFLRDRLDLPQRFDTISMAGRSWMLRTENEVVVAGAGLHRKTYLHAPLAIQATGGASWVAEAAPTGVRVHGERQKASLELRGATRVGLRAQKHWLGVYDDLGRVLWLHLLTGQVRGPYQVV